MIPRDDYTKRAWRIVDRVMPKGKTPHGWDNPAGFIAASRMSGERQRLFWRTMPRLRAKAEGGRPYIAMPKHMDHVYAGGIMEQVSREFERATI